MIALRWRSLGARSGAVRRARRGRLGPGPEALNVWLPSDIGGPQVALGRAGDGPKVFPGWEAALVALCGARGGDLRSATFPRLAPPRPQVPEVWLGPNFERFLERCPLDSEFSCDNIWVPKCMFVLRSRCSADEVYGVTYLKIVVETPLCVVLRFVLNRPLGMLPWST